MSLYNSIEKHLQRFHLVEIKKGETLYHAGDHPNAVYIIKDGLVGLFHITENGKETFLRVFGKNQILGHRSLLAKENYHANSIALHDVKAYKIHVDEFLKIIQEDTSLIMALCEELAKDLGINELRISDLNDKSSYLRVAHSIVFLKNKYPEQIWTRQEIAEFAVCTNETVTRTLTKLEKLNLIQKEGRNFSILDQEKIMELTNEDF